MVSDTLFGFYQAHEQMQLGLGDAFRTMQVFCLSKRGMNPMARNCAERMEEEETEDCLLTGPLLAETLETALEILWFFPPFRVSRTR